MASRAPLYRPLQALTAERREDSRHRVIVTRATVTGPATEPCEAVLQDLSRYGCRLASEQVHTPNDPVWLRLNGSEPISATVVWSDGTAMGCRFDDPIDRALVRSLTLTLV